MHISMKPHSVQCRPLETPGSGGSAVVAREAMLVSLLQHCGLTAYSAALQAVSVNISLVVLMHYTF